ncbi:MAG TPA: Grx4 family monothiol glutaredoxin [Thiobacillus sp.]
MTALDRIRDQVTNNPVVLYMKGTPQFPQCGFSSRAAQVLQACGLNDFLAVNVLADPEIFENLKHYADWPTFPQLYIKGELIGGSDIMIEMYQKGDMQKMLEEAKAA